MSNPITRTATIATLVAMAASLGTTQTFAGTAEIEMLNKRGNDAFVYSSDIVRIEPGDSIAFVATAKGHNAQSIQGMLPVGADEIRLGFNKSATVTFTTPGIYGVRCTPHTGAGMVTAIIVGEPVNLAAAKAAAAKLPPKVRHRLVAALSTLD